VGLTVHCVSPIQRDTCNLRKASSRRSYRNRNTAIINGTILTVFQPIGDDYRMALGSGRQLQAWQVNTVLHWVPVRYLFCPYRSKFHFKAIGLRGRYLVPLSTHILDHSVRNLRKIELRTEERPGGQQKGMGNLWPELSRFFIISNRASF
jgi:hypothetical protein